jgi:hypothetical protein
MIREDPDVLPATVRSIYSLGQDDYPLLNSAGFRTQGLFWDLLWAVDNTGVVWQAELDNGEYIQFYEHDNDMKPEGQSRSMTRQEFYKRFNV